jgi:phospholipid/cholesterol/gamma-HCH transport system substrate-binding protein
MSPYRRNVLVGATVLVGLIVLGWMILRFSGGLAAPFTPAQFSVFLISDRADGIADGSPVLYRGVDVGRVIRVRPSENMVQVVMVANINQEALVPQNVTAIIRSQSALGTGSAIAFELLEPEPIGRLQPGQEIVARYVGLELLPPEFSGLARDLQLTSQQFRESNIIPLLREQIEQAGRVMDSVQQLIDDPQMREDLQASLANLRSASASAARVTEKLETFAEDLQTVSNNASTTITQAQGTIRKTEGHIDDLARQTSERMMQIARLLEQFQAITSKVEHGEGTAGQLVNDPKLYEGLVETTRLLNATIADLQRLINQWEQEGIPMRLGR